MILGPLIRWGLKKSKYPSMKANWRMSMMTKLSNRTSKFSLEIGEAVISKTKLLSPERGRTIKMTLLIIRSLFASY